MTKPSPSIDDYRRQLWDDARRQADGDPSTMDRTPPTIDDYRRQLWDDARRQAEEHYRRLIESGDAGRPDRPAAERRDRTMGDETDQRLLPGFGGRP